MEIHTEGHARFNSDYVLDSVFIFAPNQYVQILVKAIRNLKLNTRKMPCDEKNDFSTAECADNYLETQMNCNFPWLKKHGIKDDF